MQNWEHLLTIMESINTVPTNVESDISRVRPWLLDGHGQFYRQTLAFSEINFTELRVLFAKYDHNFAGLLNSTTLPSSQLEEVMNLFVFYNFTHVLDRNSDSARASSFCMRRSREAVRPPIRVLHS